MVEPWTDDEVKQCIRELKWDGLVTALYELLDLRAKVTRLTHENQSARAERDLARKHLADANKEIYQMRMKAAKAAKGGAK